jgi:hypothetical protein
MNKHWPIVIYPEVAAAALKAKVHAAYAVFIIVKVYDSHRGGSGLVSIRELVEIAQKTLGVSKSQAYRVISGGIGVFWREPRHKTVGLFSHLRAYYNLGIEMFSSKPIRLTVAQIGYDSENYSGSYIKDLMVSCVASWDSGCSAIAVETIAELTGISTRTIRRQIKYMSCRSSGIVLDVSTCYKVKCDNINQTEANARVQQLNSSGMVKYHSAPKDGKFVILERTGNLYSLSGVERLGRRRRHRHLKHVSNWRKD